MLVIGWESNQILTRQELILIQAIYQKQQAKVMIIPLKKKAHEMRGVLLTILCYCLLQVHYKELSNKIGGDVSAKFVHIFEQTILMEDWLGKTVFN